MNLVAFQAMGLIFNSFKMSEMKIIDWIYIDEYIAACTDIISGLCPFLELVSFWVRREADQRQQHRAVNN